MEKLSDNLDHVDSCIDLDHNRRNESSNTVLSRIVALI